jgi:hypothetical protein
MCVCVCVDSLLRLSAGVTLQGKRTRPANFTLISRQIPEEIPPEMSPGGDGGGWGEGGEETRPRKCGSGGGGTAGKGKEGEGGDVRELARCEAGKGGGKTGGDVGGAPGGEAGYTCVRSSSRIAQVEVVLRGLKNSEKSSI